MSLLATPDRALTVQAVPQGAAPQPASERKALEVTNACRRYGDFRALDGIDLHVRRGEIVGILGPNGAGKSTLLRACEGLERLDEGRISMFGHDIAVEPGAVKGQFGLVLQRPRFSGYATVRETIRLFRAFRPDAGPPDQLVEALGLGPKLDVRISKLSGGERQRLAVVVGLMGEHGLILLDEPTSELDPQARRVVWHLIAHMARTRHCAILMTTHQMEEAELLCDRVYVIDHGRIVAKGSPTQVIFEQCDSVSVEFLLTEAAFEAMEREQPGLHATRHGQYVKCRKEVATAQEGQRLMRSVLDQFGPGVLEIGVKRPNLEDVFIRLTGTHLRG